MFLKRFHGMTSSGFFTGIHDTVQNTSSAVDNLQKPERKIHGAFVRTLSLNLLKSSKGGGGYVVSDVICLPLEQVSESTERGGVALPPDQWLRKVSAELLRRKGSTTFVGCLRT